MGNYDVTSDETIIILSRVSVTKDGVRIGNWTYRL
jgi:hypothetical protein